MRIEFLGWDWRGGLDADRLVAAVNAFRRGPVYAVQVDTGGDDYLVALSDEPLDAAAAYQAWIGD